MIYNGVHPKTLTTNYYESDLREMKYWTLQARDKLAKWAAGEVEGYGTGLVTLDKYVRLIDGEMITIAARPSMGKTILGMQMAWSVAHELKAQGDPGVVAVYSAEMTGWSLVHRMASARTGINVHKLRNAAGSPDELARFEKALQEMESLPIFIDDGAAPTTKLMLERMEVLNETHPVRMMLFDYMELGGNRNRNEEQRISEIAQALADIAKKLSIPVVAISQLNRSVESRANKMPAMSDLRYSGMIEQASAVVLSIMRPEFYEDSGMSLPDDIPIEDRKGVAYLGILKNKNGPLAQLKVAFSKERSMFADLVREKVR